MADPHGWHTFDALRGYEVRQTTPDSEGNRWEVRKIGTDRTVVLDDDEFEALRNDGPSPKGLD